MLEIRGLHKRLGGTLALRNCNLQLLPGERLVLTGPNGAGKSTLLKLVAGVLRPDRGSISLAGIKLDGKARRAVGYVPEAADPPAQLYVDELLALVAATRQCPPIDTALIDRLALGQILGARIYELSLGQRRRACLAAALVGNPRLLLLDEPTNGLDTEAIAMLGDILLEDPERSVLLATHDASFGQRIGTRSLAMRAGEIRQKAESEP